jgi:dihydroxyacetone kinase
VTIISGGGSGHEPAHAGFIGAGMLSCAVLGNVFASPSVASILAAIRAVAGPPGVLLVVKNYTGDRLNFGLAAEMAKQEGIAVRLCIVRDDCALPVHKGITGGRGIAGTVFVHKVAGAAAASGSSLEDVFRAAEAAASNVYSLGLALSTCTVPGTPSSTRLSDPGLIELGMG